MNVHCDAVNLPVADESIHCIVTSPPYNVGIDYDGYEDRALWMDYRRMARNACDEICRVLVPGGRAWVNVQPTVPITPGDNTRRVDLLALWNEMLALPHGFTGRLFYRDTVAWIQDSHDGACAWGSWLSPSAPNQRGGWEAVLCYYRGPDWKRTPPPSTASTSLPEAQVDKTWRDDRHNLGGDWGNDLCRNVWKIAPSRKSANSSPAPFPEDLVARCIRLSTWPGERVLDPFGGGGTTATVADKLGRVGVTCDLALGELTKGKP